MMAPAIAPKTKCKTADAAPFSNLSSVMESCQATDSSRPGAAGASRREAVLQLVGEVTLWRAGTIDIREYDKCKRDNDEYEGS